MKRIALTAALIALGCSSDATEVPIRAFEQPTAVTFVCYQISDAGQVTVEPLAMCDTDGPNFFLHALVIEESRGEVAAVNTEGVRVLDSDPQVPGFTFVPVGEIPIAIAVPEMAPEKTYIADFGTHDIHVVDTARFHPSSSGSVAAEVISLDAAPTSLVIGPDAALVPEAALYVTLPDLGAIARIARADGATPEYFTLAADVPVGVAAAPETPYCKACPTDRGETIPCGALLDPFPTLGAISQPFPPREPVARGTVPAPVEAVLDAENNRLLVADRALPIIHVVDLAAPETAQPPIVVGVPTTELALTPRVPDLIGGSETDTDRFIYAIDATDGSVLAIRYDELTPSASAVLPVSVRGDADRISLPAPARALAILEPELTAPTACSADGSEEGPLRLHGVFLAVALLDGTVSIVDVHDLDATCRGGSDCSDPPVDDDAQVFIRRHRPRIGALITTAISLSTAPTIAVNGITVPVEGDGATEGSFHPDLSALEDGCPLGMTAVVPSTGGDTAYLCVLADPWAAEPETWAATWEGAIPGTQGGRARLGAEGTPPEVAVEIAACARGVLGRENLASAPLGSPESNYQPDLFVITGELPPSTRDDEMCRSSFLDNEGRLLLVDFPIERVERVVRSDGEVEHRLTIATETRGGIALDEVRRCFVELASYEIRSQGAYTFVGSRTGYRHRVVTDATTNLCAVDDALSTDLVGKARPDALYDNGIVRLLIQESGLSRTDTAILSFQIAQTPAELRITVGDQLPTLFSDLAFNRIDGHMYVVDTAFAGLAQIVLNPVRLGPAWE